MIRERQRFLRLPSSHTSHSPSRTGLMFLQPNGTYSTEVPAWAYPLLGLIRPIPEPTSPAAQQFVISGIAWELGHATANFLLGTLGMDQSGHNVYPIASMLLGVDNGVLSTLLALAYFLVIPIIWDRLFLRRPLPHSTTFRHP